MIEDETVQRLLEPGRGLLSLYLPIEPGERDLRAHESKLRNMLDAGRDALERQGMVTEDRDALLAPLHAYASGIAFAEHRDPGLAIFARSDAPPHFESLPRAPREGVFVGPDFHIKPLLPLLAENLRFYILALSRGDVRLFAATPFDCTEVKLEVLPPAAQAELNSRAALRTGGRAFALPRERLPRQVPAAALLRF